jgi:hypothetical protein
VTKPTHLYRHFAVDGTLLYVGVSLHTVVRLLAHREDGAAWFDKIARVEIEMFATRKAAEAAEAKANRIRETALQQARQ